jgi:hypothetical protein
LHGLCEESRVFGGALYILRLSLQHIGHALRFRLEGRALVTDDIGYGILRHARQTIRKIPGLTAPLVGQSEISGG